MDYSQIISCGYCNNISKMEIIGSIFDNKANKEPDPQFGYEPERGYCYDVLKCPACKKINIVKYYWHESMENGEEVIYEKLFPQNEKIPLGMPENILKAYNAAEKVKTIDVNAYAILMRRLLELVCIDRKAKGETLAQMLKDLSNKNEIPVKLVDVAKGLKDFGNLGAHVGIGEMSEKEIPILNALSKAILEYIYSAPYLADIAEKKLKGLRKK